MRSPKPTRSSVVHVLATNRPSSNAFLSKDDKARKPRVVIVGGGWAGFGSAHALQQAGAEVVLLDAAATPGGLAASWKSAGGRTVEPGIKGWGLLPCISPRHHPLFHPVCVLHRSFSSPPHLVHSPPCSTNPPTAPLPSSLFTPCTAKGHLAIPGYLFSFSIDSFARLATACARAPSLLLTARPYHLQPTLFAGSGTSTPTSSLWWTHWVCGTPSRPSRSRHSTRPLDCRCDTATINRQPPTAWDWGAGATDG